MSEPWKDDQGNIPLDKVLRACAPGVGLPSNYTGGFDNPCTDTTIEECQARKSDYNTPVNVKPYGVHRQTQGALTELLTHCTVRSHHNT